MIKSSETGELSLLKIFTFEKVKSLRILKVHIEINDFCSSVGKYLQKYSLYTNTAWICIKLLKIFSGRLQRSSNEVSCDDIAKDPKEACENYHFRCQACANDTILLQHSKAFTHVYYTCTHVNSSTQSLMILIGLV